MSSDPRHDSIDLSTTYGLLCDERSRAAVHVLAEADQPLDLSGLGVRVAQWIHRLDGTDQIPVQLVLDVQNMLTNHHLPKLADAGVIEWDGPPDTVTPTPLLDHLAALDVAVAERHWVADDDRQYRSSRRHDLTLSPSTVRQAMVACSIGVLLVLGGLALPLAAPGLSSVVGTAIGTLVGAVLVLYAATLVVADAAGHPLPN